MQTYLYAQFSTSQKDIPTVLHLSILFESSFSTCVKDYRKFKDIVYPMPIFLPSPKCYGDTKWYFLKWTVPQVEIEILFLMMVWDRCILCRDNRKNYSVFLLSNFHVKASGLQTGKKKKCGKQENKTQGNAREVGCLKIVHFFWPKQSTSQGTKGSIEEDCISFIYPYGMIQMWRVSGILERRICLDFF